MRLRSIVQIGAGLLLVGIIAGYTSFQLRDFRAGPEITITTPEAGATTSEPLITIAGTAERIAYLSLNGRQIYTDRTGHFSEQLLLTPGYNIITVAANDTFDRSTEQHVGITLHASSSLLLSTYNHGQARSEAEEE